MSKELKCEKYLGNTDGVYSEAYAKNGKKVSTSMVIERENVVLDIQNVAALAENESGGQTAFIQKVDEMSERCHAENDRKRDRSEYDQSYTHYRDQHLRLGGTAAAVSYEQQSDAA